jgi:PhnB protein
MQLNPYLLFNGQCEAAFKFYEQCLGGKITAMQTHGDSPMAEHVSPEWRDKIIHARLILGDNVLMGSDTPPEHYAKPQGFSVALHAADTAEAERVFHALAENGTVQMPIQETFWAFRFGMLVDQFGTPWMVNHERAVNP